MWSMNQNAYFNRMMRHFTTLFGAQKVASVFGGTPEDQAATAEAWEAQLRNIAPETIKRALEALTASPPTWPPSLAEWIVLCRDFSRVEHRAVALPAPTAPTEVGREISQTLSTAMQKDGFDYLFWAKHPGSVYAVRLLARGAKQDRRLRNILDRLLATDGKDCRREDALREILRMKKEHEILHGVNQ
jgi:hypothetical protein